MCIRDSYGPSKNEREDIIFDYKMGEEWNDTEIITLFEFLSRLLDITSKTVIKRCAEGCYDKPDIEFGKSLMKYYKRTRAET